MARLLKTELRDVFGQWPFYLVLVLSGIAFGLKDPEIAQQMDLVAAQGTGHIAGEIGVCFMLMMQSFQPVTHWVGMILVVMMILPLFKNRAINSYLYLGYSRSEIFFAKWIAFYLAATILFSLNLPITAYSYFGSLFEQFASMEKLVLWGLLYQWFVSVLVSLSVTSVLYLVAFLARDFFKGLIGVAVLAIFYHFLADNGEDILSSSGDGFLDTLLSFTPTFLYRSLCWLPKGDGSSTLADCFAGSIEALIVSCFLIIITTGIAFFHFQMSDFR